MTKRVKRAFAILKSRMNVNHYGHPADWEEPRPPVYFQDELDRKCGRLSIARALARCECAKAQAMIRAIRINRIHANR